jgi:hypothetical protein
MEPEVVGAWTKPTLKGSAPVARGGHTAVLADYQMIIFGGHYYGGSSKFEYLNDTHVLDVETSTWHNVRCGGEIPEPRYGHSSIALGSKMFVFGGRGKGKGADFSTLEGGWGVGQNEEKRAAASRMLSSNEHEYLSYYYYFVF